MSMKKLGNRDRTDRGFTLIELLVVILIIAILAAIAIPIFLNQRKKSYVAQSQSALKNAATAIESYSIETGGDFTGIDGADSVANNAAYQLLSANGYKKAQDVQITVAVSGLIYCVTATHPNLNGSPPDPWYVATYSSNIGSPVVTDADAC
ncbi:MAG: type pilus assembly protein PilA [Actinomycetota bacterium]|jgi:type IV pilus assembly protein PilA|nr:type pilus assembly protein PilA [Actinomycetota bacterium]